MKNFGMEEPEQYMASKGRPRHGTWISTSACTVMLSASETSLAIARFAESKMI